MFKIAIDGPSGAGKSTISKVIAKKLGFIYIDTGAMYRAAALGCVRQGVDVKSEPKKATEIVKKLDIDLEMGDDGTIVYLNGEDVSGKIRTPEISLAASAVSAIGDVRVVLVEKQREMGSRKSVIMDGRDIGTHVLPDADVKIFLTASSSARAKRRYDELLAKGENVTFSEVLEDMELRDKNDSTRAVSPLKPADDAVMVDTTEYSFDESVDYIHNIICERLGL